MAHYNRYITRIAQVGLVSKGVVYSLFGALIIASTFSVYNQPIGLFEVIKFIINTNFFGRLSVFVLALGLLCYALWKYFQMVYNVEGYQNNLRGIFMRISWFGPFLFHLFFSGYAFSQLYFWYTKNFEVLSQKVGTLQNVTNSPLGFYGILLVSLGLLINGITLFYLANTGKYKLLLSGKNFFEKNSRLAGWLGFLGYNGYGAALLLLGLLFGAALLFNDVRFAQGHQSLFYFLILQPYGKILLSFIALGTISYGAYFFLAAFYRWRSNNL
jgi:hypothetical protein